MQYSGPDSGDVGPIRALHIYDTHATPNFEDITLANKGQVTVFGEGGNDTINANFFYGSYYAGYGGMTVFAVYGGDGNDTINATTLSTTSSVLLSGDAGNDVISISSQSGGSDFSVDGGTQSGGGDTLNWNDSSISGTHTYTPTGGEYSTFETISYTGGTGSNIFNITYNSSGTTLNLTGNSSADTFNIGGASTGSLNNSGGTINISGAGGTDTVNINDASPTTGFTYTGQQFHHK